MDYKEQLISMVKEAENLPKSELEQVPGTDLWVKKGEVAKLFSSVQEEIKDESEEYYNAKAYEIYKANEDNIAKFERFNKNLDSINANYEKLSKQLAKLQGKVDAVDKEKLDKIMHDIREYAENRDILTNIIVDLVKNEINANFVKAINEQMEDIRNSFLTSPRGTEIGYGDNGLSILASDKPEYDSLIGLLRLMNTIDTNEKIVSVDGVMCVNASKVEEARKLLSKVKAFKRLKTESKEDRMEKANQKLIDEIVAELRNIESKVKESKVAAIYPMDNGVMMTPVYKDRYKDLLKILKYLNEANDKKFALTSIWDGIAFVNGPDREAFIELISRTEPINAHNPNNLKRENNNKLIAELEEYLKSMENDFNTYNGVTNIASAVTKNNTIVLEGAVKEYDYIYDIIEILKDTEGKELYDVLGIASVSYDNITRFEYLVSKTKKLGKMIPEIEENKAEIETIKARLTELNNIAKEKAKTNSNIELAPNGVVLASDLPEYEALVEKLKCLEKSKGSSNLTPVNGAMIDKDFADKYAAADQKLEDINKPKIEERKNKEVIKTNGSKHPNLNVDIAKLISKGNKALLGIKPEEATLIEGKKILNKDVAEYNALLTIKRCLENAEVSNNLVEFDGVKIDDDDYADYIEAISTLDKVKNSIDEHNKSLEGLADEVRNKKGKNPESKKERHKVSLRKLKDKVKFKRKRKETISEGIIKTIGNRVKNGVMHPVRTIKGIRDNIKGLGKTAKESYQSAREKVKNGAEERRNARKNKNIQEQVAEELKTEEREEQQTTAQIVENVQAQILENSKKRLSEIVAEQNGLEENSPEYQALDKEAQDLRSKIAELEGINPYKSVPIPPVTNIAPDTVAPPVVAVPPTDDILNTLDGAAETTSSPSENPIDISTLEALRDQYLLEYEAIGNPMDLQAISLETKLDDLNNQIAELRGGSRK